MNSTTTDIARTESGLVFIRRGRNEPFTTSLALARAAGRPHNHVLRALIVNWKDVENFGGITFETGEDVCDEDSSIEVAILNESQAQTIVIKLGPPTDRLKLRHLLVHDFASARRAIGSHGQLVPHREVVFLDGDSEPFTTSLVIAAETGNQHKSLRELIEENLADLNEVGMVRFQTAKPSTSENGGGRPGKYAELDEPAAALLMTYLRNSPPVKDFKKRLVHGFYAMRQELARREAQVRPALPDIATPEGVAAMAAMFSDTAQRLVVAVNEKKMLEAAIERDAPLVAKAEAHTGSKSNIHRQEFAREVQAWGHKQGVTILQSQVMRFLGHIRMFVKEGRSDSGHASSWAEGAGLAYTHKGTADNGRGYAVGRLTAAGQDYAWRHIIRHVGQHGSLEFPRVNPGATP